MANKSELIPVVNLPKEKTVIIDSIIIHINNALEGSRVNSKIEGYIFNIGNRFHAKTRLKTIKISYSKNIKINSLKKE